MGFRKRCALVVLILAFALTSITAYGKSASRTPTYSEENSFQIHFLNQGRVDAILIVSNGEAMFIDSGYRYNGLKCIQYMKRMGITKLRYYIGTHAHKNHIGGAAPIIYQMRPEQVFIPHDGVKSAIVKYAALGEERQAVESANYTVLSPGNVLHWNDLTLTCLGPINIVKCSYGSIKENYNSLILRIDRGNRHMVLLTGDTGSTVLSKIELDHPGSIRSEVLKNPHHSNTLPESILKKISPKIVAVCNSRLPSSAYRKRILKLGSVFYSACRSGNGDFMLEDSGEGWIATENIGSSF
jgi:competence protein ComEC